MKTLYLWKNVVLKTVFFLLPLLYFHYLPPFSLRLFFPWWKLSEASPSATVFIFTKLCPLLKAFQCCSTLWALSCLVSLLVTLLALTGSQVKLIVRASCICVCVCTAFPISPSPLCDCIRIRATFCLIGLNVLSPNIYRSTFITRVCEPFASPLHVTCHHFSSFSLLEIPHFHCLSKSLKITSHITVCLLFRPLL